MNDYDDETKKALEYYRSHRKWLEFWEKAKGVAVAMGLTVMIAGLPVLGILLWGGEGLGEFWKGIVLGGICAGTFVACLDLAWK